MKINNLTINNFRSFTSFHINGMGKVTLLVGMNNSGKTTILEAINILLSSGSASAIWQVLSRRGEDIRIERDGPVIATFREVDVRRLFNGHQIDIGSSFNILADSDTGHLVMSAAIIDEPAGQALAEQSESSLSEVNEEFFNPLSIALHWSKIPGLVLALPVSSQGGISLRNLRRTPNSSSDDTLRVRYVTASSVGAETVRRLFEEVVLTPTEELVTQAIRIIEPGIERIASSGESNNSSARYPTRGGMWIKLKGYKERVPIGSMGDGIWRMLGLALSVVQSAGGMLLVDEIDTGLHHTVMKDLWKFLFQCAREFDVQIVATTHSRDCFQSLATICREDVFEGSDVTIHRIEKNQTDSVAYTEQEIIAAAELDMEVR
jgi:ABC-type branched-subunit amino acid transport system ATPase component